MNKRRRFKAKRRRRTIRKYEPTVLDYVTFFREHFQRIFTVTDFNKEYGHHFESR